jgi:hypothetical protein
MTSVRLSIVSVACGAALAVAFTACHRAPANETLQFLSHDARSGEWEIVHSFQNGVRVKMTAVCAVYHWGQHDPVSGPDTCDFRVGQTLVANRFPERLADFLDIEEVAPDSMTVIQDSGPDRISETLKILSSHVMQIGER